MPATAPETPAATVEPAARGPGHQAVSERFTSDGRGLVLDLDVRHIWVCDTEAVLLARLVATPKVEALRAFAEPFAARHAQAWEATTLTWAADNPAQVRAVRIKLNTRSRRVVIDPLDSLPYGDTVRYAEIFGERVDNPQFPATYRHLIGAYGLSPAAADALLAFVHRVQHARGLRASIPKPKPRKR